MSAALDNPQRRGHIDRRQSRQQRPHSEFLSGGSFHDGYTLQQKLGKGAFAAVYLVQKVEGDSRASACKVTDLRQQQSTSSGSLQIDHKRQRAAVQEIELLNLAGGHENVIRVMDCFVEFGLAFVVMEMCDRSLLQVLERMWNLTEESMKPIFRGMLKGLAAVHERGVVHRDVKPDNFMCKGPGDTVKLCDFGLASRVVDANACELTGINGTPPYMAPEMLKNERYGGKVDVWSFGVIAYVLCFGRFPHNPVEQSGPAMKAAIVAGCPPPTFTTHTSPDGSTQLSHACVNWLRELLCRDPSERPSCNEALQYSFFHLCNSGPHLTASLRPMLSMAKRCGAFDVPLSRSGQSKASEVDLYLQHLQEQNRRVSERQVKMAVPTSEMSTEVDMDGYAIQGK